MTRRARVAAWRAAAILFALNPVSGCGQPVAPPVERDGGTRQGTPVPPAAELDLGLLKAERPAPAIRRDLFRFEESSGAAVGVNDPVESAAIQEAEPERGDVSASGLPFRLIGIVAGSGADGSRTAVLSDGRDVYHGSTGDIIEGRFRIVQVLADAVELEAFDGGSRQRIRLPDETAP